VLGKIKHMVDHTILLKECQKNNGVGVYIVAQ
jgi:hypothetical protein